MAILAVPLEIYTPDVTDPTTKSTPLYTQASLGYREVIINAKRKAFQVPLRRLWLDKYGQQGVQKNQVFRCPQNPAMQELWQEIHTEEPEDSTARGHRINADRDSRANPALHPRAGHAGSTNVHRA